MTLIMANTLTEKHIRKNIILKNKLQKQTLHELTKSKKVTLK